MRRWSRRRFNRAASFIMLGLAPAGMSFLLTYGFDGPQNNDALTLSVRKRDGSAPLSLLPSAPAQRDNDAYWLHADDTSSLGDQKRVVIIDTRAKPWSYTSTGQSANLEMPLP